jgi:hypothetical protein
MTVRTSIRLAVLAPAVCAATLLAACGSTGGGSPATGGSGAQPASGSSAGGSQPGSVSSSSSNAKCTDVTAAALTAAVGKSTTVALDTSTPTPPGLTICNVTVANEVYPVQLAVNANSSLAIFNAEKQQESGVALAGVGDDAFTDEIGVEAISGSVDIEVTGPAGAVLGGDDRIPTAIAKAMVATLH